MPEQVCGAEVCVRFVFSFREKANDNRADGNENDSGEGNGNGRGDSVAASAGEVIAARRPRAFIPPLAAKEGAWSCA